MTIPAGLLAVTKANFVRGAALGAASDLISKESDAQNAMGALRARYGWFDTPLATKDDHPVADENKKHRRRYGYRLIL